MGGAERAGLGTAGSHKVKQPRSGWWKGWFLAALTNIQLSLSITFASELRDQGTVDHRQAAHPRSLVAPPKGGPADIYIHKYIY